MDRSLLRHRMGRSHFHARTADTSGTDALNRLDPLMADNHLLHARAGVGPLHVPGTLDLTSVAPGPAGTNDGCDEAVAVQALALSAYCSADARSRVGAGRSPGDESRVSPDP